MPADVSASDGLATFTYKRVINTELRLTYYLDRCENLSINRHRKRTISSATLQSRSIVAGFLNANTDRNSKAPANYGLMDIIAALHWLKENIGAFGGDASSVTLAGHGTGAACVHFLISSNAVPEGESVGRCAAVCFDVDVVVC